MVFGKFLMFIRNTFLNYEQNVHPQINDFHNSSSNHLNTERVRLRFVQATKKLMDIESILENDKVKHLWRRVQFFKFFKHFL